MRSLAGYKPNGISTNPAQVVILNSITSDEELDLPRITTGRSAPSPRKQKNRVLSDEIWKKADTAPSIPEIELEQWPSVNSAYPGAILPGTQELRPTKGRFTGAFQTQAGKATHR